MRVRPSRPRSAWKNMMGTNPLVFAIPTDEPFAFVTDYATSITQRGKIEVLAREDKPMPEGWGDRRPRQHAHRRGAGFKGIGAGYLCAVAPSGSAGEDSAGYKGYGYTVVVEVLSSALQAGNYLKMLSGFGPDGQRVPTTLSSGAFLHGDRHCGLHRAGKVQADRGRHHAPPARLQKKRRGTTGSTLRAKKNICTGRKTRTGACRWTRRCKRP